MSFENTILSERNQIPKNTYSMTPFDEMSRTGRSTGAEKILVVASG